MSASKLSAKANLNIANALEILYPFRKYYGLLIQVSTKTISAPRSFKRPGILPEETENFIKGKSRSSQWSEICEMNISLGLPTFLSNEKLRIIRVLNQPLKIPRRLLTLHVAPNPTILHKDFSIGESDSAMRDWLLLQRNIDREIITRLKRRKSTQSSCEKDGVSKKSQGCIEDHRQSAEFCAEKTREKSNNGCQQISEMSESREKSCSDLLNHQEYYRSIESSSPIYSDKPVPYNDRRACDSMKRESRDSRDLRKSTLITCENWTCGKSAMERKIYHKCKPKSCAYPNIRDEATHFPKSKEMTEDKPKRVETVHSVRQHSKTEPSYSEKMCTSSERKTSPMEKSKMSKPCSVSDTNEQIKPDPPPPRYQHWSENPPPYCDRCSNKTVRTSPVKPSPMIFVPRKESWKSRTKGIASSLQDIHEDRRKNTSKNRCDKTDVKAKITSRLPKSVSEKCVSRRVISFENKCAASLAFPAVVNKTKPRVVQRFPTLTKSGDCRVEKPKKDTPDVSDCNLGMASFKYRLSKCPCIKEMRSIGVSHESSEADVDARPKQEASLSVCEKIVRQESRQAQEKEEGRRKRFVSSGGWTRQTYKIRLKIFQKGNGCLDPCLPRIIELRQPRGGKMRSKLFGLAADEGELSPRLKSPRYCPLKWPIVETKSYPTKMNESRVVRDKNLGKRLCKKRH